MVVRVTVWLTLAASASVLVWKADGAEPPSMAYHFSAEPAEALIRQMEPGPGIALTLPLAPSTTASAQPQIAGGAASEVIWADPATGLELVQRRAWLGDLCMLSASTTIRNRASTPARASGVRAIDCSFRIAASAEALRYRELSHRNETWYGSTFWSGPDWTRVGRDWHHPGENTPSVRRFTAPRDGRITVAGRVYKAHVDAKTDGVRLAILHGPREVWKAEIDGDDAQGAEPRLTLDVRKGDAIRFVVHKRGTIVCDTTHWDPVVTYADGPAFQASQAFFTGRRAGCPWSYEMDVGQQSALGLPSVHGLRTDGSLWEARPAPSQAVAVSDRELLPLVVLTDGRDSSGVAVAIEPGTPWQFRAAIEGDGCLRVQLAVGDEKSTWSVKPGESIRLPQVAVGAYRGTWVRGLESLQGLLGRDEPKQWRAWREVLTHALRPWCGQETTPQQGKTALQRGPGARGPVEIDFWAMIQLDWQRQDGQLADAKAYAAAAARHLEKARALVERLRHGRPADFLAAEAQSLDGLARAARGEANELVQQRALYLRVRSLKRRIALANPLMPRGPMLFCKRVPTSYSHLVMQYFGWRARAGGGLFVLDRPGCSLACRDILDGKLSGGNVLEPRLSWDAQRIVFSFVQVAGEEYDPARLDNAADEGFYHVYDVSVDGSGLRQLTRGPYDDLMPTYLPDGGIVFCSTRRRGYARCFGAQFSPRWHVYTLHRMDGGGGDLRALSFHDTNEWFPAVSSSGSILYSRWDYIDRDAVTHQNLWTTRPDGSNPQALWGNATAAPHCAFQIQPIPGSHKIAFTASAHHSIAAGSIVVVDPAVARDGEAALSRITPEIPFPEAESRDIREYYEAPWPLSEDDFLVGYSPLPLVWEPGANPANAVGICLLDRWGNRELIYRDPEIGSTNPCPLVPRPVPPALPSQLAHKGISPISERQVSTGGQTVGPKLDVSPPGSGELAHNGISPISERQVSSDGQAAGPKLGLSPSGEMILLDIYQGLAGVPRGNIRQLRVVQIFPKTTHVAGSPPIGLAGEENGRAILGTVPVEPDGSARFLVPAQRPLLFQALDANGFAYQTMRSVTYVQPGERVSCVGCHEGRMSTPVPSVALAAALRRGPSPLDPGPLGGRPFSFVEVVQPVLDQHCVRCHGGEKTEGKIDLTRTPAGAFTKSYLALCGDRDFWHTLTNPTNAAEALVPRFGARNQIQVSPPGGMYGALGSRLLRLLQKGHYEVKLTPDDFSRLAAWIDLNAIFYGVNNPEDQARLLRGEIIPMPEIQ